MVSPYIEHVQRRMGVSRPDAFATVRAKAEYRPEHYSFSRQMSDRTPLEKTDPPLEPMWKSLIGAALIVVFIAFSFFLAWVIK